MITTCFDCRFRNIQEVSHEWTECHCKFDGHWHNPYRPEVFYEKACPNWVKIGEEDDDKEREI